jgi:hypothetical protein
MNRLPILVGLFLACALATLVTAANSPFAFRPSLAQASEPWPEIQQAPDAPAQPAAPRAGISAAPLQAALPAFFADNEDTETNLRQLQMYYRLHSIKEIWDLHMAPLLAPGAGKTQADEPPYSPEELEAFRTQMDGFLVDLKDLLDYLPEERVLDMPERVQESRQLIATATDEQLAQAKELYDQYPGYLDTPSYVLGVLEGDTTIPEPGGIMPKYSLELPLRPNTNPPVPSEEIPQYPNCVLYGGHGIGDNGTCTGCPKAPAGGISTVFALDTAAFVNGAICEYIPEAIFVLSVSIQNPFSLLCTALRASFEIAAASVKYANDLNGRCEERYHRGIIHAYLDAEVSTRATQQSFNFYSARDLRLQIEDNLLDVLDDRVSTYQLPHSQLGYLDAPDDVSVRYVVTDTIHMQELAGYTGDDIYNAVDEYNAAEALRLAGDYKSAYARYRKSYRAAVRVGRQP